MRSKLLATLLCIFISVTCETCSQPKVHPPSEPDISDYVTGSTDPLFKPVFDNISGNIYIDATVSMGGFVMPANPTNYGQFLPCLERAFVSGWSNAKVNFYKFGTKVVSINRSEYLRSTEPVFYQDTSVNLETHIQKVTDQSLKSDLKVIVTDLFQTDRDITILMEKIKENYIQKNLAVGVLGIRSQFDGFIFDVSSIASKFRYSSGNDHKKFRPFYVLILGKHTDVEHYFEQLKLRNLPFISENNFIIFSRYLVYRPSSFENASIDNTECLVEFMKLVALDSQDKRLKQFRIRGNTNKACFTARFDCYPLPYIMSYNPENLESEIIAEQFQADGFRQSSEAKNSFTIDEAKILIEDKKSVIIVKASIKPLELPGNGVYRYEVILRPRDVAYINPTWVDEWSMKESLDGSKTINLNTFLSDLRLATYQVYKPKVAKFYCYIKKG